MNENTIRNFSSLYYYSRMKENLETFFNFELTITKTLCREIFIEYDDEKGPTLFDTCDAKNKEPLVFIEICQAWNIYNVSMEESAA